MSLRNITFILHKPQLSENIGACARALKNFNFNNLSIVNPKPSFPNDKIIATSVGAKDIIKKDDPKIKKLLHEVKDREFIGYSYDGADASFELLARLSLIHI